MQDPSPAPQPPSPPPPPTPQSATIVTPGGTIPLGQLPRTAQEVQGLRERREILRDQLSRASNRREELVTELDRGTSPEARVGIQQRLALLDERILQIEQDQAATERLLSNAPAEVLAQAAALTPRGGMVPDDEAAFAAFAAFGFGIFLAVMIGRFRRRRRRKRGGGVELQDPRMEQLAQAVDAIAEEVERIGEGQRFVTQLLADGRKSPGIKPGTGPG